jgi:hypothetical protein
MKNVLFRRRDAVIYGMVALVFCCVTISYSGFGSDEYTVALSLQDASEILGGGWKEVGCGMMVGALFAGALLLGPMAGSVLIVASSSSIAGAAFSLGLHSALVCALA